MADCLNFDLIINWATETHFDFDQTLFMLMKVAKQIVPSDRCTIWILDQHKKELWTKIPLPIVAEIHIPVGAGFVGRSAETGLPLILPFDCYESPEGLLIKKIDEKTQYRTCSILCVPIFNFHKQLIGVTQLVNKLRQGDFLPYNPEDYPLAPQCWQSSFNDEDLELIKTFNNHVVLLLQIAQEFTSLKKKEFIQNHIINRLEQGLITLDKQGKVTSLNQKARELINFQEPELELEAEIQNLIELKEGDLFRDLQIVLSTHQKISHQQQVMVCQGGETKMINLTLQPLEASNSPQVEEVLLVLEELLSTDSSEEKVSNQIYPKELSETSTATILYAGIRSFTPLLEMLDDLEIAKLLKEYFGSMSEAVFKYKGTIDKYVGDSIISTFTPALTKQNHAWYAVQSAIEMRQKLIELNVHRLEDGKQALRMGIGINSADPALQENLSFGNALQKASKIYGCDIIISENTYRLCHEQIWARELDIIKIKNPEKTTTIYQLVALKSEELPEEKIQVVEYYAQGRHYYRNREFAKAIVEFNKVLEISSWDIPAALQLERCQQLLKTPPPAYWDGAWEINEEIN